MNPGYANWKTAQLLRQQEAAAAAAQAAADAAAADATQALTDAAAAQGDATTGIADAAAAQSDANDAIEDIASLNATVSSVTTQTEQLFNAAGQVATPYVTIIPYTGGLQIVWACTTPSHSLFYRINAGSWTAYSGAITLSPGDDCEAYATASGLTDSEIALYSA